MAEKETEAVNETAGPHLELKHPPVGKKEPHTLRINRNSNAIQILHSFYPFADANKGDDLFPAGTEGYIHRRIQQRNVGRRLLTVQGMAGDHDKKKLVKAFKKKCAPSGTVIDYPECGEVILPQGDQCKNIGCCLLDIGLAKDDQMRFVLFKRFWLTKRK
nr:eukaryotic translation initiation factor 1-like [Mirounga angustirostris]